MIIDAAGTYGSSTKSQVRAFQYSKGLNPTGFCDATTWNVLIESHWKLGDRLLYLRTPMLRGDDVSQMQGHLSWLGFDPGKIDGTFGPNTHHGLAEFQVNIGMTGDGICGPETIAELTRNYGRSSVTIYNVKEMIHFDALSKKSTDTTIAIASGLGLNVDAELIRSNLVRNGFRSANYCHYDLTTLASLCNESNSDLIIYLECIPNTESTISYFRGFQYTSEIGQSLAKNLSTSLRTIEGMGTISPIGSTHRMLQLTKAPCIVISITENQVWSRRAVMIASLITTTLTRWFI